MNQHPHYPNGFPPAGEHELCCQPNCVASATVKLLTPFGSFARAWCGYCDEHAFGLVDRTYYSSPIGSTSCPGCDAHDKQEPDGSGTIIHYTGCNLLAWQAA